MCLILDLIELSMNPSDKKLRFGDRYYNLSSNLKDGKIYWKFVLKRFLGILESHSSSILDTKI